MPHAALSQLAASWRSVATYLENTLALKQAIGFRRCADDLEQLLVQLADEPLTLKAAAAEAGLSVGHLARLVRNGQVPNSAPPGKRPRIRRADVPTPARRVRVPLRSPSLT